MDFASGSPVTVNEIVTTMAAVLGADVAIVNEGAVPEYIEFRSADHTMKDRFGVAPRVPFADGLKRLATFLMGPNQ